MVYRGSGGDASATTDTGEVTLVPSLGLEIVKGKPQSACGAGLGAGGITEIFVGGTGVTEQLATFGGKP